MRNSQDVSFTALTPLHDFYKAFQIPIPAGHEFIVTADLKYKDICDDKYMYMDYVSWSHYCPLD